MEEGDDIGQRSEFKSDWSVKSNFPQPLGFSKPFKVNKKHTNLLVNESKHAQCISQCSKV